MSLTRSQKRWAIGGSIGAAALFLGYELFRHREGPPRSDHFPMQFHGKHKRHKHHKHHQGDNARGEYGTRHHHKGHKHG